MEDLLAGLIEQALVAAQMLVALSGEGCRDAVMVAELLGGQGSEVQPVVPQAAGVLERLVGLGGAARRGGVRRGFELVARLLGGFPDGVEIVPGGRFEAQLACGAKGAAYQGNHLRGAEGTVLRRLEGVEQGFERAGNLGLTLVQNRGELLRVVRADVIPRGEQVVEALLEGSAVVGIAGDGFGLVLDELVLHVEVADSGCGAAQFLALLEQLARDGAERRQALHELQQGDLRFDPAGFGAELVHGALVRRG